VVPEIGECSFISRKHVSPFYSKYYKQAEDSDDFEDEDEDEEEESVRASALGGLVCSTGVKLGNEQIKKLLQSEKVKDIINTIESGNLDPEKFDKQIRPHLFGFQALYSEFFPSKEKTPSHIEVCSGIDSRQ